MLNINFQSLIGYIMIQKVKFMDHFPQETVKLHALASPTQSFTCCNNQVVQHNAENEDWEMELNMFADMTEEEKASYTGFNASQTLESIDAAEEEVLQYVSNPSCKCKILSIAF